MWGLVNPALKAGWFLGLGRAEVHALLFNPDYSKRKIFGFDGKIISPPKGLIILIAMIKKAFSNFANLYATTFIGRLRNHPDSHRD